MKVPVQRLRVHAWVALGLCIGSALPAVPAVATEASGEARMERARDLLEIIGYSDLMRRMSTLVFAQPLPGGAGEEGDGELLERWFAAAPLQAIEERTADDLAGHASIAQLDQALAYFRSPAGRTELACVRAAGGAPVVRECLAQEGGEEQLRAHEAFAGSDVETLLGKALGESFGPELFAALSLALENDPSLKDEVGLYCKRQARALCAMVEVSGAAGGAE